MVVKLNKNHNVSGPHHKSLWVTCSPWAMCLTGLI